MSVAASSSEALEGFCTLAKSSTGSQLVMVIRQVLKQPSIFVFGELLDGKSIQNVRRISTARPPPPPPRSAAAGLTPLSCCAAARCAVQLQGTEHQPWLDLLRIFAYGSYKDYKSRSAALSTAQPSAPHLSQLNLPPSLSALSPSDASPPLPELSAAEVTKLKCLTLVSLASTAPHHVLAYSTLSSELDLPSTRDVEALIGLALDQSLIDGRLDQRSLSLSVSDAMGRDVGPSEVAGLRSEVAQWVQQTQQLILQLDSRMREVREEGKEREAGDARAQEEEARIRDVLKAHRDHTAGVGSGAGSKAQQLQQGGHAVDPLMAQAIHLASGGKEKREGGGGMRDRDPREGKQRKRGASSFFAGR